MGKLANKASENAVDGKRVVSDGDFEGEITKTNGSYTVYTQEPITPEKAFSIAGLDPGVWEISRSRFGSWDGFCKLKSTDAEGVTTTSIGMSRMYTTMIWVDRIPAKVQGQNSALQEILSELGKKSPVVKKIKRPRKNLKHTRELEICLMDPHFGMRCHRPESDHPWSLDMAREVTLWALNSLLEQAEHYGPFEKIVFPFGNDFLHVDNLALTTTGGTPQPESEGYKHIYKRGLDLAVEMVEVMKQVAPVQIYQIPGNHDWQSSFTLGLALEQRFWHDENVEIDASASPYKFHRAGCNLIGYEHGHSVNSLRLGMLMANECSGPGPRQGWWDETTYREWHVGDQHRKATGKPSHFEEQSVSVEFLPGLTPPNDWHRLKSFNWQKRGACAFVWDHVEGPKAKLLVNMDSNTGKPMVS